MSTETKNAVVIGHLLANVDLTARQYTMVRLVSDGGTAKWDIPSGAGGEVQGILLNKPDVDQAALVQIGGVSKLIVGAAGITAAARMQADGTTGHGILAASGDCALCLALETGVDNDIISVLMLSPHILA